jgi:hypothetical protein
MNATVSGGVGVKLRIVSVLTAVLACVSCTEPDATVATHALRRDSAGVQIVDLSQASSNPAVCQLDTSGARSIGTEHGSLEQQLFAIRGVVELSNGNLVVANGGSNELRWFGADGGFVRATGGNGDGPGEFRGLAGLITLSEDSILAYDSTLKRFQVFDSAGQHVRGFQLAQDEYTSSYPAPLGRTDGGELLIRDLRLNAPEADRGGRARPHFDLVRYDRVGRFLGVSVSPPAWETFSPGPVDGITVSPLAIPFSATTLLAVTSEALLLADTESGEIEEISFEGSLLRLLRPPTLPAPVVTSDDVRSYRERAMANVPLVARELFRQVYEQVPIPETKPRLRSFTVSKDGIVWLVATPIADDAGSEALILDPEWNLVCRVLTPDAFEPMVVSRDRVVGVTTDDLGVESVREYYLRLPSGS